MTMNDGETHLHDVVNDFDVAMLVTHGRCWRRCTPTPASVIDGFSPFGVQGFHDLSERNQTR